ncbi:hypothetical protein EGW08_010617 [Elysia chlorotica]|uniref:Tetratricopeptide repeat protein 37 n=1 Tax=Elysia chlorotica TaxID=188477 RepID=A0A3S0ZN24_ELYCH|nr:hypothetical protein EGW08_010617 [Elysia chlorotica]
MDGKEIKTCLKAAREFIRNKEFKDAAKQCKAVLAVDPNNYNALVFLGVTAEGLENKEQALKAYKKATQGQPDQLLAWQGISSMLEKNPDLMTAEESIEVFEKLVNLHKGDETKQLPQLHKLVDLHVKSGQKDKALKILNQLLELEKDPEKRIKPLCSLIALMVTTAPKLPQKEIEMYESSLKELICTEENLLSNSDRDHYGRLLLILMSQIKLRELSSTCDYLIQVCPALPSAYEFQLRFILDNSIGEGYPSKETCDNVIRLTSALCGAQKDNPMITVGQAFSEIQNKNYTVAKDLLTNVSEDSISGSYFLAQACLSLHSSAQCLEACKKGLTACSKEKKIICAPLTNVLSLFELAKAEAYLEMGTEDAHSKALMVLEEVQELMPIEAFLMKAYIYLDQGKIAECEDCFKYLPQEALPVQTLKATILYEKKDFTAALKILQSVIKEDESDARATLVLGKVLWELRNSNSNENLKQQCFTTLLKAAKLDPYNYEVFLFIGQFYKQIQQDLIKARRCFQKAFDLRPENDDCSAALVDTLLELGEEDQSLKVLQKVTQMAPAGCAKWAWLRLGLHQMRQEDPSTAIMSLQSALRADPQDQHVWECLAEAYLQRGSFTAALKAFTKASELNPESWYCFQQIASIKHTLGLAAEAIKEYETILKTSPTYVPALKGISESLIQLAKQNLSQCLDGLAQSHFEEAITYTVRAASQRPDMSCLWKLMGDACSMASCLAADSYSVPIKLVGKQVQDESKEAKVQIGKMELLKVGSRCYSQALRVLPESGSLWHDLAVNLFYQSQYIMTSAEDQGEAVSLARQAAQVMKKAIMFEPKEWRHWNALGVIGCSKVYHNPALAQHCFIKSIECESSNVTAWTNLGALYLDKGEVKMAHEAFTTAQSIDPTYMACWIGQALIAEIVGHKEAMDLFRHTTELGFHVESAIGYGKWVLSVLADSSKRDSDLFRYCILEMAALPAASDALTKYTTRVKDDATAFNMQGLLLEHQNLFLSSVSAFEKALMILEKNEDAEEERNKIKLNLARVMCKQKKYGECVQCYEKCDLDSNLDHMCMYGLALLRCERFAESLKVYHIALDLAQGSPAQSEIYAALGMIAFIQGDLPASKSYLFDGFQTAQPSVNGLLALCSLGLLQGDITLATAVLDELHKRKDETAHKSDILYLGFFKHMLEEHQEAGLLAIEEYLKANPTDASVWSLMARTTLACSETKGALCAEYARVALKRGSGGSERGRQRMLQSLGQLSAGHHSQLPNGGNALKSALKAYHANPGCVSSQVTLASAIHAEAEIRKALDGATDLFPVEESFLQIALSNGDLNDQLQAWCLQHLVINSLSQGNTDKIKGLMQGLQEKHSQLPDVEVFLQAVTGLICNSTDAIDFTANNRLSFLVKCSLQEIKSGMNESITLLNTAVGSESANKRFGTDQVLLERIAFKAYKSLQVSEDPSMMSVFENTVKSLKDKEMASPITSLLQAFQTLKMTPDNKRLAKHFLATGLDQVDTTTELGYLSSILRQQLLALLWDSKKETDKQMVKGLLDDARAKKDHASTDYFQKLCS